MRRRPRRPSPAWATSWSARSTSARRPRGSSRPCSTTSASTAPASSSSTEPRATSSAWLPPESSLAPSAERERSEPELGLRSGLAATAPLALENARRFHETEQGKARAQAAAAHSERRLRNLAQDLTAIVWEVDAATWRTIYVSHAAEKILGYPVERWYTEGDFWLSHLHPDDRVRFLTMRLEPASRADHELEYRMIAADGRVV